MTELHQIAEAVRKAYPAAEVRLEPPVRARQAGWLDIEDEGRSIVVEWRPGVGFGVSALESKEGDPLIGLFEGPDEVFSTAAEACSHVFALLSEAPGIERQRFARR